MAVRVLRLCPTRRAAAVGYALYYVWSRQVIYLLDFCIASWGKITVYVYAYVHIAQIQDTISNADQGRVPFSSPLHEEKMHRQVAQYNERSREHR